MEMARRAKNFGATSKSSSRRHSNNRIIIARAPLAEYLELLRRHGAEFDERYVLFGAPAGTGWFVVATPVVRTTG